MANKRHTIPSWFLTRLELRFAILISVISFFVFRSIYLIIRFSQLGLINVIVVSTLFAIMAGLWILASIKMTGFSPSEIYKPLVWATSVALSIVWWSFASPTNNEFVQRYAPEWPIKLIDSGGEVAPDTFFHSSIISSIMHFGYPSTGLDGVPFTAYHALSHYVDSGILIFSGLTPLDSAGLLLQMKIMLFVSSVIILVWVQLRETSSWIQLSAPIVLVSSFTGTWHVVGSHGLWFTTFMLIITAPFVFSSISSERRLRARTLFALGALGITLSFGKLSVGFMFMLIVGLLLWFREKRDPRIYVLGGVWTLFMLSYTWIMAMDRPNSVPKPVSVPEQVSGGMDYLLLRDISSNLLLGTYGLAAIFIVLMIFRPTKLNISMIGISIVGLAFLTYLAASDFDQNDRFYFSHALFFIMLTIALGSFGQSALDYPNAFLRSASRANSAQSLSAISMLIIFGLIGAFVSHSDFNFLKNYSFGFFTTEIKSFSTTQKLQAASNGLEAFRKSLDDFMVAEDLNLYNSRLFISHEIWKKVDNNPDTLWSAPMMIYSATGVPLEKGVFIGRESYGFSSYGIDSISPSISEFNRSHTCETSVVIKVLSWSPARFESVCSPTR
jgi:hypothetical protein